MTASTNNFAFAYTTCDRCAESTSGHCLWHQPVTIMQPFGQPVPMSIPATTTTVRLVGVPVCPDLLRYEQLGVADGPRGRIIRAFFWLLRMWP